MTNRPKFHVDENMSLELAAALRRDGYDVTTPEEVDLLHAEDEEHLLYAAANKRVVLTFDIGDYPQLNADFLMSGREHWGIIISTDLRWYEVFKRLRRMFATITANDMRNQIRWLNEFR